MNSIINVRSKNSIRPQTTVSNSQSESWHIKAQAQVVMFVSDLHITLLMGNRKVVRNFGDTPHLRAQQRANHTRITDRSS